MKRGRVHRGEGGGLGREVRAGVVRRNDRAVARMLLAAVDALNRYFCSEPYKLPG
ncbi:hypothetical protein [Nonomuraea sp. NPDC003709]|uniref:hypothetical protein n=1 Tax=Nonomuraea sp. NPDC003709 TaxID=3154450 RepID=UPI0033A7DA0C